MNDTIEILKLLLVDDEEGILSSLKRLLMDEEDLEILTASSGEQAMELLREHPDVAVIVSDQRMPGMTGAEFLGRAREAVPQALRIILTGYADINATMEAINRGGASRYLTKPWNDQELSQAIRDAASRFRLEAENRRLTEVVNRQNEELKEWNANLKQRVLAQTGEIRRKNEELQKLNVRLTSNYTGVIHAFSTLTELKGGRWKNHAGNVTELATAVAMELRLKDEEVDAVNVAALLHDIGKIGVAEEVLRKRPEELDEDENAEYFCHPVRGQAAIDQIEDLRYAGVLIRHHHERFDGKGFPDGLKGEAIPLGARIIAFADRLDHLTAKVTGERMGESVLELVRCEIGNGLDRSLFPIFQEVVRQMVLSHSAFFEGETTECELDPRDLLEGMVTADNVYSGTGLLLLVKGTVLDLIKIESLKRYYLLDSPPCGVRVLIRKAR